MRPSKRRNGVSVSGASTASRSWQSSSSCCDLHLSSASGASSMLTLTRRRVDVTATPTLLHLGSQAWGRTLTRRIQLPPARVCCANVAHTRAVSLSGASSSCGRMRLLSRSRGSGRTLGSSARAKGSRSRRPPLHGWCRAALRRRGRLWAAPSASQTRAAALNLPSHLPPGPVRRQARPCPRAARGGSHQRRAACRPRELAPRCSTAHLPPPPLLPPPPPISKTSSVARPPRLALGGQLPQ